MERNRAAKVLLVVDSIGCAAALGLFIPGRLWRMLELPQSARPAVLSALGATSALLAWSASRPRPSRRIMCMAAAVNAGWVATCAVSMVSLRSPLARATAAMVLVFDAVAGIAQWRLRPPRHPGIA